METISGIYKIKNLINNKIYIGKSINIKKRYKEHFYYHLNFYKNYLIYKAFKKYKLYNFNFEIIELIERNNLKDLNKELNEREKYYIKKYKSNNRNFGYNMTDGGNGIIGYKINKKTRQKMSKARKGKKLSEETKRKLSIALKGKNIGKNNGMYGKKISQKTIKILKARMKGKNHPNAKKIICLNNNQIFFYAKEASLSYNIQLSHIIECCQYKLKSAGKDENGNRLQWMYYDEYLKLLED